MIVLKDNPYPELTPKYIGENGEPGEVECAVLDLTRWKNANTYLHACHKGKVGDFKTAYSRDYSIHWFWKEHYLDDMEEINFSKEVRSGGPMTDSYKWRAENVRLGYLNEMWGVFTRGGKLVAYIKFRSWDNFGFYSQILGHGDYLKDGIMAYLHVGLIVHCYAHADIKCVMYGAWDSGHGKGLQDWKRRLCFEPRYITVAKG